LITKIDVDKRQNGFYTCLDCKKLSDCEKCISKNWELFELDKKKSKLSYAEKNKLAERK
jgi:hypothetical protein